MKRTHSATDKPTQTKSVSFAPTVDDTNGINYILNNPQIVRWFETGDQQHVYTYIVRHVTKRPLLQKLEASLREAGLEFKTTHGVDIPFPNHKPMHCYLVVIDKEAFVKAAGEQLKENTIKPTAMFIRGNKLLSAIQMQAPQHQQELPSTQTTTTIQARDPEEPSAPKKRKTEEVETTETITPLQLLPIKKRWIQISKRENSSQAQDTNISK